MAGETRPNQDLEEDIRRLRDENAQLRQELYKTMAQRNRLMHLHGEGWAEAGWLWGFLLERGLYEAALADLRALGGRRLMRRIPRLAAVMKAAAWGGVRLSHVRAWALEMQHQEGPSPLTDWVLRMVEALSVLKQTR